MNRQFFLQLAVCLFFFSFSVYSYLDKQNSCTELKMRLPKLTKEIQALREANAHYQYQIECFESPEHLLQLASRPEFAHLKFPFTQEVLTIKEGLALQYGPPAESIHVLVKAKAPIIIGAKP